MSADQPSRQDDNMPGAPTDSDTMHPNDVASETVIEQLPATSQQVRVNSNTEASEAGVPHGTQGDQSVSETHSADPSGTMPLGPQQGYIRIFAPQAREKDSQPQEPERPARPTGWALMQDRMFTFDEASMKYLSDDIDTLLVFAGLFSAVLTSFLVGTYLQLQPDNSQTSIQLLSQISAQLASLTVSPPFVNSTQPSLTVASSPISSSIRWVNGFWFLSLLFSLAASMFCIITKQWIREFLRWKSVVELPQYNAAVRQFRLEAWERWRVPATTSTIPALLELALVLFVLGIVVLLWTLDIILASVITAVAVIFLALLFCATALPAFIASCPYKSPIGWAFTIFWETVSTYVRDCRRGRWTERRRRRHGQGWAERELSHRYAGLANLAELAIAAMTPTHILDQIVARARGIDTSDGFFHFFRAQTLREVGWSALYYWDALDAYIWTRRSIQDPQFHTELDQCWQDVATLDKGLQVLNPGMSKLPPDYAYLFFLSLVSRVYPDIVRPVDGHPEPFSPNSVLHGTIAQNYQIRYTQSAQDQATNERTIIVSTSIIPFMIGWGLLFRDGYRLFPETRAVGPLAFNLLKLMCAEVEDGLEEKFNLLICSVAWSLNGMLDANLVIRLLVELFRNPHAVLRVPRSVLGLKTAAIQLLCHFGLVRLETARGRLELAFDQRRHMCGKDFLVLAAQLNSYGGMDARELRHSFVMLSDCAMMDMLSDIAPCVQARAKESEVDSDKQTFNILLGAMTHHATRAMDDPTSRDCGALGDELRWAQTLDSLLDLDPIGTELRDITRGPRLTLLDTEGLRHVLPLIEALEKNADMGLITRDIDKQLIAGLRERHRLYPLGPKPRRYSENVPSPSPSPTRRLRADAQISQMIQQQRRWGPLYDVRRWIASLGRSRRINPVIRSPYPESPEHELEDVRSTTSSEVEAARLHPTHVQRFSLAEEIVPASSRTRSL